RVRPSPRPRGDPLDDPVRPHDRARRADRRRARARRPRLRRRDVRRRPQPPGGGVPLMTLAEILQGSDPDRLAELSRDELRRLFWMYKGLVKRSERDTAYWQATNDNLRTAYERLDEQERELARAYQTIRQDLEVAQQV